ncbi:MAG: lysophospholipid acyltransferase family protein [Thermoanaerobaculia bacterium]|nr:lysophospholipid acyltransferase family protein [Thermoanaerobaculia bacterium]
MTTPALGERPAAPPAKRARHAAEHALFTLTRGLVRVLPLAAVPAVGALLGDLAGLLDRQHRRVALDGVRLAFPELEERCRRAIVRASFRNLGRTVLDAVASSRLSPAAARARYELEGLEHLEAAEERGRGVLLMTAHFGNWEAAGQGLALSGHPIVSVARPLDNPRIERWVSAARGRFGNTSIPKRGGGRQILETLRDGGRLALLIDQRVHPNEGKAYRFFGEPAYTSPLLADASLRTGAPVLPFYGYPIAGGRRVRLVVKPPIPPVEPGEDAVERLTLGCLAELEEVISADPGLWLWMHRRWRKNPTWIFKKRLPRHAAGPDSDEVIG